MLRTVRRIQELLALALKEGDRLDKLYLVLEMKIANVSNSECPELMSISVNLDKLCAIYKRTKTF